jgi:transposase
VVDKSPDEARLNAAKGSSNQTLNNMQEDFGLNGPYQIAKDGTNWILSGTENAKIPGRVYLYINPKGDYEVLGAEAVRSRYMAEAKAGKGIEYLRKRLYDAGYMQKSEYDTKDVVGLARAITEAASKISVEAVMNFQDSGITITQGFDTLLNKYVGTGGDGRNGSGLNITSKTQTDQEIDDYFFEMLGRRATSAEKKSYYELVNKEEKAALIKQTTSSSGKTTTVGEYLDADDYSRIKAIILKPAIKGTDLEGLTKNNGKVAQDVQEIKEYASSFGIKLDTKQALDKVMGVFTPSGKTDLNSAKNTIKSMAKGFYGNISGLIDEGVKPSDIANQYAYYKGRLLGMPDNSISIFDEDIQAALSNRDGSGAQKAGVMSIKDYEKLLRTSPKTKEAWLKSPGAREEASGYALEILRSFGLMA